ncbi:MAG: sulfatase-like hydrolase/transferase, partial [Candidatus Sumerlaeota bacterium]|nr:sulfatase-like hydrolase/transferase [Candidatus Sumerlaeota bacterium]
MNVIVLVNDSLRLDHVSCYDKVFPTVRYHGKRVETPNLDKLAAQSAKFNYCFPENLPTLPFRTGLMTGRYTFPFRGWQRIEPTDIMLAEILWDKGFKSAVITDTYHMHKATMAYERGFDEVIFVRGQEEDPVVVDKTIKVDVTTFYKTNGTDKRMLAQTEQYLRNISQWT